MSRARASNNRRLPPLLSVSPVGSRLRSPRYKESSPTPTSRYHRNCYHSTRQLSPGPGAYLDTLLRKSPIQRSPNPKTPRSPKTPRTPVVNGVPEESVILPRKVAEYLQENSEFLEDFVLNQVDVELLERWIIRKTQRECKLDTKGNENGDGLPRPSLSRWKFCVHADKRQMLQELTNTLFMSPEKEHVLSELARTIASAVNATAWTLYLYDNDAQGFFTFGQNENSKNSDGEFHTISGENGATLASHVAKTKETVRINTQETDPRFPDGVPVDSDTATFILCHPILQPDEQLSGVLELYRNSESHEFHEEDEEIVNSYLVWGGISLHYAELYGSMMKQRELGNFLLTVVKSIFQDMVSMDTLIIKIMVFAQKLVNADRASLFLVDGRSSELFARIFDVNGSEDDSSETNTENKREIKSAKEIRFPIGKGIAGYVAMTGESLNIHDAYNDQRFNRSVDQQTGYITKNLLCMPIFIRGRLIFGFICPFSGDLTALRRNTFVSTRAINKSDVSDLENASVAWIFIVLGGVMESNREMRVRHNCSSIIGVVQMVNKFNGHFTKDDEEAFATFAIYCGLALHHAKLYDKIRRSEQKYKVALEILSYHNTCNDIELENMKSLKISLSNENLRDFAFTGSILNAEEKVAASIFMYSDLFGTQDIVKLDFECLVRFTLTVRKNYRRVPYHNWDHGFSVANSVYVVLHQSKGVFKPLEELSLFVACLCHDLDHRGKTNQFLVNSASPLAAIYTTSTLEHHHFNMTVSILQQEGHNILKNLSSAEYKQVLNNIKHCILATDLALFFPNKAKLSEIAESGQFDKNNTEHRMLLEAVTMTGCDLCASTKSWEQQSETVKVIFEEFYEQGDEERLQGREPIPMMDRNKIHEQPQSQVGFLKGICIPCYELLYQLIPQSKPMLDGCKANLERWMALAEQKEENEE